MIVPPEIRVSTLLNGLTQQAPGIKRFIVFKHSPGHDQHLGGQLYPDFGFYAPFTVTTFEHTVIKPAKAVVVVGGD